MKKSIKTVLAAAVAILLLSVLAVTGFAAQNETYTDSDGNTFTYTVDSNGTAAINGFSSAGSHADLVIPSTIGGYTVTTIQSRTFKDKSISSVYIPNSIQEIGYNAFENCSSLQSVVFAEDIACTIRQKAFLNCGLKEVYVPTGVKLESYAFSGCADLEKAVIGTSWTASYLFENCIALKEVTYTENCGLREGIFYGCSSLETIHSPTKGIYIYDYLFYGCESLTNETLENIIDLDKATSVGCAAFYGCKSLAFFDLSGFYRIDSRAFMNCTGFEEIILPDRMKAFKDGTPYISDVFAGCTNVKYLYIGKNFADRPESIGLTTLSGLENIEVSPENQKYFSDDGVLYYRDTDSINLLKYPAQKQGSQYSTANVVDAGQTLKIYDCAFMGTKYLKELELTGNMEWNMSSSSNNFYKFYQVFEDSSVEKLVCRDDVLTYIGNNMFKNSSIRELDLRKAIRIGVSAFEGCENLEIVSLLKCTFVDDYAFANCPNLQIAIFGVDTVDIYSDAFLNDDKLTFYCNEKSWAFGYAEDYGIPVNSVGIYIPNQGKYPYTGTEVRPPVLVSIGTMTLTQGVDYIVHYEDNTNIGTGVLTITFIGNFEGLPEMGKAFSIVKKDVSELSVEYVEDYTYSGDNIKPVVIVKNGDIVLTEGVDYTIRYSGKSDAGTMLFTITGIGNYTGSADCYYNIVRCDMEQVRVSGVPEMFYTGDALCPKPTLTWNGFTLQEGVDYEIQYFDNVNSGYGTMVIYGLGNFCGAQVVQFRIFGKPIDNAVLSPVPDAAYTGDAIQPSVTVMVDGSLLVENVDYIVRYRNNTEAGTATVLVEGIGNYSGVAAATFTIYKNSVYAFTVFSETQMTATYDGTPLKPEMEVYFGTELLTEGVDYTVSLENNTNAGTAVVTICGIGRFEGERSFSFTILPCAIDENDISVSGDTVYSGTAVEPQISIYKNGEHLEQDRDYTVTYSNNNGVGTAFLTVTGIGNYCDSVEMEFEIRSANADKDGNREPEDQTNPPMPEKGEENTAENNSANDDPQPAAMKAQDWETIPKTGSDTDIGAEIVWLVLILPILIALNLLEDKLRQKRGKKTFADRIRNENWY